MNKFKEYGIDQTGWYSNQIYLKKEKNILKMSFNGMQVSTFADKTFFTLLIMETRSNQ